MLFNFSFVAHAKLEHEILGLGIATVDVDVDGNPGSHSCGEVCASGVIHTASEVRAFEGFFKAVDFNLIAELMLFVSENDELPIDSKEQLLDFLDTY